MFEIACKCVARFPASCTSNTLHPFFLELQAPFLTSGQFTLSPAKGEAKYGHVALVGSLVAELVALLQNL